MRLRHRARARHGLAAQARRDAGREGEESRIQRIRVAGKSAYMAPEHARGDHVDARADLFAAGILLWELCAGRRLYRGSEAEMLELAKRGDVPQLPDRGLPEQARLQSGPGPRADGGPSRALSVRRARFWKRSTTTRSAPG